MARSNRGLAGVLLATLPWLAVSAGAQVCPNTIEVAEQTLWNQHNCWTDFRDWHREHFNLQESHWDDGWGWTSCGPTLAFPKMLNAGYLLTYGLTEPDWGPWHSNEDYYTWASGDRHGFRYEPENATDAIASAFAGDFQTDRVEMKCPSFNGYVAGSRAGTMLHEATHIIYWRFRHQSNPPGSNCAVNCSDDWFFHLLGEYRYGELEGHRHSMNQIQIEFLCDLSELGQGWVPAAISTSASAQANSLMVNRIRNPPGWTCGQPRPVQPSSLRSIVPVLEALDAS